MEPVDVIICHQGYRFGLDPPATIERALWQHVGAVRFVFNWGLALVRACLAQRDAERSYGVAEELLTPVPWGLYELRRRWNQVKDQVLPPRQGRHGSGKREARTAHADETGSFRPQGRNTPNIALTEAR